MSNVRPTSVKSVNTGLAPSNATKASFRGSPIVGARVLSPPLDLKSRFMPAVRASPASAPPSLCRERAIPSRSRSVLPVKQSIQNRAFVQLRCFMQEKIPSVALRTVSRPGTCRCSSTPGAVQLVSSRVATQRSWWRQPRPNPFIEGTHKRLRLLRPPHVKR